MAHVAVAFEESARQKPPVAAPADQRDRVAALLDLVRQPRPARSADQAYKLTAPTGEVTEVPEAVFLLLERMLEALARGDAVTVVPVGKELTTQQAADILNVSRQYLVRLLDDGRVPYRRTGTHRRVRIEDVMAYKRQRDRDREAALDDLTALSLEFGGYGELEEGG